VYWGAGAHHQADHVKAFSFNANNSGLLSISPTSQSTQLFSFSTDSPTISANGNSNGILWILDNSSYGSSCCQILYAFDATNLANVFYSSSQASNNRDQSGGAVKFTSPVVANGKVYAGGQASITTFGLLPPSFGVSASPTTITIPTVGGSGNTGISITPVGGFTGTVNLTCSVVFAGTGTASNLPTCSFDSNQVKISGTASGSSMLEISTTGIETASRRGPRSPRYAPFPAKGVGILACACLLGTKGRRRRWISALMLLVLVALIGGSIGCGGGNESPAEQAGTTAGRYTVTVSATSDDVSASDPVTVVVQ
jgi:trimeric autotransporter adhesin